MASQSHAETMTYKVHIVYPTHEPREHDPHYHFFHEAHERLKRLGALKCWIGNKDCAPGPIELHHDRCEFALANDVDYQKFNEAYGLHLTSDEDFLDYIEQEGNLLPLCLSHHRSIYGIHSMPYPVWVVQRYLKDGIAAPARAL